MDIGFTNIAADKKRYTERLRAYSNSLDSLSRNFGTGS